MSSDFDFNSFSDTLDSVRKNLKGRKTHPFTCSVPGCNEKAINSHLVQRHQVLSQLCKDGKVLQMVDNEKDPRSGDWSFGTLKEVGNEEAMSEYLFCGRHDNDIFAEIEKGQIDVKDLYHLLLVSFKAVCVHVFDNTKILEQYQKQGERDDTFTGEVYDEVVEAYSQIGDRFRRNIELMWSDVSNKDTSHVYYEVVRMPLVKLAICDCVCDESDIQENCMSDGSEPVPMCFINCFPDGEHSWLVMGYDVRYVSDYIKDLVSSWQQRITVSHDKCTLYDIILECKHWCISPDAEVNEVDYIRERYELDKVGEFL